MPSPLDNLPIEAILYALRVYVKKTFPGFDVEEVLFFLNYGKKIRLPVSKIDDIVPPEEPPAKPKFVPTPFQQAILDALKGKALRTDALAAKVGDRSNLFRKPGGIHELKENGLVANHPQLGYYSLICPPPELEDA